MHTTSVLAAQRRAGVADEPDWPALTARSQALRRETLANLGRYLPQIEAAVQARGGQVIWAENSAQACQAIVGLAQRAGLFRVWQSRSPLPLEIGLAGALGGAGIQALRLDHGEFLADLNGQRPAHPNAGAANRRIDDIVSDLHARLDMPVFLNAEAATRTVRMHIRRAMLQGGLALLGLDFAVAETGALVTFDDQGGVRAAAALAPVIVAIMGLEQVAPTWEDLWLLRRVRTRSANGRAAPVFVECFSGASEPGREFYLILLDNGRAQMLANGDAEMLACIQCGACFDVCPAARRVGSQPYAWSVAGPVGAVMGLARLQAPFDDAAAASTLCGACRTVCPVGIDLPRQLLRARAERRRATPGAWIALALRTPDRYATLRTFQRLGRWLSRASRSRPWLAPWLWRWTAARDLPPPAAETFRARWARRRGGQIREE